jgi:hypothetical protein
VRVFVPVAAFDLKAERSQRVKVASEHSRGVLVVFDVANRSEKLIAA